MNSFSCMTVVAILYLGSLHPSGTRSSLSKFIATTPADFSEPLVDADLLIVNRWETVKFPAPPDFSPLSLLPPMVTTLPVDWDSVSKEPVPWWLPELREARGDEVPAEWPPRRKEYRERYAVIADSRVTVDRPDGVAWRRHDAPPPSSAQVKFIRGRAVAV
jgi:hypothetical protein